MRCRRVELYTQRSWKKLFDVARNQSAQATRNQWKGVSGMATYTPSAHDALCLCENTQEEENTQRVFTQEEIDAWN